MWWTQLMIRHCPVWLRFWKGDIKFVRWWWGRLTKLVQAFFIPQIIFRTALFIADFRTWFGMETYPVELIMNLFYCLLERNMAQCAWIFQATWWKAYNIVFSATADTLKSMVQQFDSQLNSKETFLHDQRSRLNEKDKVIINQKTEIERLEKKSKTLEYKVLSLSHGKLCSFQHFYKSKCKQKYF